MNNDYNNYFAAWWIILTLLLCSSQLIYAQHPDSVKSGLQKAETTVQESLHDTALIRQRLEDAEKMFGWKVQENDHAYMMSVDVPYPDFQNPKNSFSITVVKFKGHKRPRVISFAVSSMIDPAKGLSIYFAGYDKSHVLQMSNIQYEHLPFTEVTSEYLKVSADYMYLDKEEKKDLFDPMLNNNHIVFNFYDRNGQLYKVSYPLLWFKDKIEELK
jgi:hypothetical protein